MLTRMLIALMLLCLLELGICLPIVISRNGGSSRRRRREKYIMEERRRVNTCCVARMVIPDIKLGECPNIINEYKQLYAGDSVCFLKNYYTQTCDIVAIKTQTPNYVGNFIGFICMLFMLYTAFACVFCLGVEIHYRIVTLFTFLFRSNH